MAKEGANAQVRLPSGEVRMISMDAKATIGTVSNADHSNVRIGKAGRTRHMGIRPSVRGVVMNPCDHPHGSGEGKKPGWPARACHPVGQAGSRPEDPQAQEVL